MSDFDGWFLDDIAHELVSPTGERRPAPPNLPLTYSMAATKKRGIFGGVVLRLERREGTKHEHNRDKSVE